MTERNKNVEGKIFMLKMSGQLHKIIKRESVEAGVTMHDLIISTLEDIFLRNKGIINTEKKD